MKNMTCTFWTGGKLPRSRKHEGGTELNFKGMRNFDVEQIRQPQSRMSSR